MDAPRLFPIFLKIEGRLCLVVGAGTIAEVKIGSLLASGAIVRVIAPHATPAVQSLAADGKIDWLTREFRPEDLSGAFLVIAATSLPELNRVIFEEASRRGVLCNSVDDPPNCDFHFPAVVQRGDLQVAISTAGKSPALAQQLREEFDRALDPSLGERLDEIGRQRREIMDALPPSDRRKKLLHDLASAAPISAPLGARPAKPGCVYLIGAGPGDPELLTIRARALLESADIVLHDDLVAPEIVALAGASAEIRNVGKRCGPKKITQPQINDLMIQAALSGRSVARLKSGDPAIFGRLNEELAALQAARVDYEIVPGVTACLAAAASVGASLTDRTAGSRVVIVSNHHSHAPGDPTERPVTEGPVQDWHSFAGNGSTLVFYMPGHDLASVRDELLAAGMDSDTPAVLVSRAATAAHREAWATLDSLDQLPPLDPPSILLLGRALRLSKAKNRSKTLALLLEEVESASSAS